MLSVQQAEVLRQLAVEEGGGISAAGADHAPVSQGQCVGRSSHGRNYHQPLGELTRDGGMKWLLRALLALVLLAGGLAGSVWWWLDRPLPWARPPWS